MDVYTTFFTNITGVTSPPFLLVELCVLATLLKLS